jgi:hypothetical protein
MIMLNLWGAVLDNFDPRTGNALLGRRKVKMR